MPFAVERERDRISLTLDGANAIECALDLRDSLVKCGAPALPVVVNAERCGVIDLAVIQILAAMRRSCPEFRIENASDEFLWSLDRCGLRRSFHTNLKDAVSGRATKQ